MASLSTMAPQNAYTLMTRDSSSSGNKAGVTGLGLIKSARSGPTVKVDNSTRKENIPKNLEHDALDNFMSQGGQQKVSAGFMPLSGKSTTSATSKQLTGNPFNTNSNSLTSLSGRTPAATGPTNDGASAESAYNLPMLRGLAAHRPN